MREFFFVTGLPRSRSAWLANLLNHGISFCHHEAIGLTKTVKELAMDIPAYCKFVGDSSSGLYLFFNEINEAYPDAKWLFVDRNREQAEASYMQWFNRNRQAFLPRFPDSINNLFNSCEESLRHMIKTVRHKKIVNYDWLENNGQLREICEYLTPGNPFVLARVEMLQSLQVNQMAEKAVNAALEKGMKKWA